MLFEPLDEPAFETFDIEGRLDIVRQFGSKQTLDPVERIDRRSRVTSDPGADQPEFDDEEELVFASNNTLGLARDDRVQQAAKEAVEEIGTGACAARIAAGDTVAHRELEHELARTKGTDRALLFSSGYAANVGTIPALFPNVVFSDEYNHTSIIEASRMSGAEIVVYDHRDMDDLRQKMAEQAESGPTDKWLVVSDTVFSMDGDVAPLEEMCDLADEYGAWVMADEAHATGLYGDGGGIVEREGLEDRVDIQLGTLSKALAAQGGYIAGDEALVEYLSTAARSFVFSAGLVPPAAAAAKEALQIAKTSDRPDQLHENTEHLRSGLEDLGFDVWGSTHIVPVIVGKPSLAKEFGAELRDHGILVQPVPYPGVPAGTSRLRVLPSAAHTSEDIEEALEAFETVGTELGVIE